MSKLLTSTPKKDGFFAPIESIEHKGIWMIWPLMKDNWQKECQPARTVFAKIANSINKHEPVKIFINKSNWNEARKLLDPTIKLIDIKYQDSWARDMGQIYLINKKGQRRAVHFHFTAWGMKNEPNINPPSWNWNYEIDNKVGIEMTKNSNIDYYQAPIVLEGGSIHQDGEGTIYTTEECLLNPNRNPDLTKEEIEEHLKQYLNAQKIIWIPRGVYNDETSGHVDNLLHIITPGHVVLTWTDDKNDPQYERSLEALMFFKNSTDAKGRKIKVTKLHQPAPLFITKSEAENHEKSPRFANRTEGFRMPASYVNFYITNKTIIIPVFNDPIWDKNAINVLQNCFPNHKINSFYTREVLLGGGNIHCITQQDKQIKTINPF